MKDWLTLSSLWKEEYVEGKRGELLLPKFKKRGLRITQTRQLSKKKCPFLTNYVSFAPRRTVTSQEGWVARKPSSRVLCQRLETQQQRRKPVDDGAVDKLQSYRIRFIIDNNYKRLLESFERQIALPESKIRAWLSMMRVSAEELFTNLYDFMQAVLRQEKGQLRFKLVRSVFECCLGLIRSELAGQERGLIESLTQRMLGRFGQIEAVNMLQGIGVQNLLLFMNDLRAAFEKDIYMNKLMGQFRQMFSEEQASQLSILYFKEDLPALSALISRSGIIISEIQFFLLKSKLFYELPRLGFNPQLLHNTLKTLELLKPSFCRHLNDQKLEALLPHRPAIIREVLIHIEKNYVYYEKGKSSGPKFKALKLQRFVSLLLEKCITQKSPADARSVVIEVLGKMWLSEKDFLQLAMSGLQDALGRRVSDQQIELMVSTGLRKGRYSLSLSENPLSQVQGELGRIFFQMEEHFLKSKGCMDFLNQNPEEKDNLMVKGQNAEGGLMLLDLIMLNFYNEQIWFRPETFCVGMKHQQIKLSIVNYWMEALAQVALLDSLRHLKGPLTRLHREMKALFSRLVKQ